MCSSLGISAKRCAVGVALAMLAAGCAGEGVGADEALATSDAYADLVTALAGEVHRGGLVTVLGVRGQDVLGERRETSATRAYDDHVVVLDLDGRAWMLPAATHPWERTSTQAPDVDRDGAGDVGMIRPGVYLASARPASRNIAGSATYHLTVAGRSDDRIPGWRDTDHDGVHSPAEQSASEARGDALTAVLFHRGGAAAPAAIGCQVLDEQAMRQLTELVGGPRASFNYVLVDASALDASDP
jgi:hypothetical protein